ncbi:Nucleoid-associated protein NdpA [Nitrincola lacisaponensis]|uniref:Nucleoid-associated protein NdpA n=1 Tax=Nitrincola lacisaponensis TaxID=267850 RepID=A0A063Y167_9GAMM|nr:nucleoid-associated protein [Nitrincola lacisaponensis]KDE38491.1 Nucleoid-associated protein NdpA [Nitrincola lacisaponensis]
MPVTHFSIQQINKTDTQQASQVTACDQAHDTEQYAHSIISEFKRIQGSRAGRQYGMFSPEHPGFRALLMQWREEQIPFVRFCQQVTRQLALQLDQHEELFQGYLCFLAEHLERGDRLFIFHLRQTAALTLNTTLELLETDYIEFSETGFGVAIDLQSLTEGADKYLTLSFGRGDRGIKPVVCEWLGYMDTVDKKAETEHFLALVDTYCNDLPSEESQPLREKVIDYCMDQDKAGEPVVFAALSDQVDAGLERYVRQHQQSPKEELIPDRKQLRNYLRFTGKNNDVSISFASTSLGKEVEFDPTQEVLMIRNLPKSLLRQLKKLHDEDR